MKKYLVSFLKDGDLYESIVMSNSEDEARHFIANKENIPFNFEILGDYYNTYIENNHVSSVVKL